MNWSQPSVRKIANAMAIANKDDVDSTYIPDIHTLNLLSKAALSVIAELPEVRGLVEAAFKLLAACGNGFVNEGVESSEEKELKKALAPFTNKGEPL